jgi:TetR/AcrR family transcriptional regulator
MGILERKEREKEQRREEILQAAQSVFFEKGLQTAIMDEIAETAELSKGTLYLYYKSKEDLYLAVLLRGLGYLEELFRQAIQPQLPVVTLIRRLQQAYIEFFRQHRNYFRMLDFFEAPQFHKQVSEEMREQCSLATMKIWQMATNLITRGIREGELKAETNPRQAAVMFWLSINGLLRQMDRDDPYWNDDFAIDFVETLNWFSTIYLQALMTDKGKSLQLSGPEN